MASTYTPIATTTLGSAVSSVVFSSIPSTYTDLVIIAKPLNSGGDMWLQFNSDTGTNYSSTWLWGNGTTAGSSRDSNNSKFYIDWQATGATDGSITQIIQLQNYSNTTTYKTGLVRNGRASAAVDTGVCMWRSTAAISTITFLATAQYQTGSTFTIYGIKAA